MKKTLKYLLAMVFVLVLLVSAVGCGGGGEEPAGTEPEATEENAAETPKDGPTIVVGSKTFTEALLLGELTYQYLENLGYPVENKTGLGELAVIRPALESQEISAYWEYTGTVLINVMGHEPSFDEAESYNLVKEWDAKNNIEWLEYAPLNDTYAIMVRQDVADKYGLKTTSDLVEQIKNGEEIRFVTAQEWVERPDGKVYFEGKYNYTHPDKLVSMAALNISYEVLKNNQAEMGLAFTTDPRISAYNLLCLEDDQKAFPVYNAAPLFRKEILEAYPDIPEQMKRLSSLLDNETIMALNKAVDIDKKSVEEVSKQFLTDQGLIK